jgi:hypothetical protein
MQMTKGPLKQNNRGPPWWVGGSNAKKGPGSDFFWEIFYRVFLLPHQETPKNVIKKEQEKNGFGFLVDFFVKTYQHDFFCKTFFVVFLNSYR